jgi:N-succinyldiaminopimelate aminotransferase
MHQHLDHLHPYPFQKLSALLRDVAPPADKPHIALSIGEPRHPPPAFVLQELSANLDSISRYPVTRGSDNLRQAIADWLSTRFKAKVSADTQVLPVNGTREALFAFAQCVVDNSKDAAVIMPNPFYQIYEGAAILAGAQPWYLNTSSDNGFIPDIDSIPESVWKACQLFYACSPGNPTGAVMPESHWLRLLDYADRYDFVIAADECYSEIYPDESNPPAGLLQVCTNSGRDDFSRCVVFHSLSKRSNLPGLRSGFVAGDAEILKQFLLYRTYHGCAMSLPVQIASIAAWKDEQHVYENRQQYREKFSAVLRILQPWLPVAQPEASFYLWPELPGIDDTTFTRGLFEQQHVTVLPGSYLSRDSGHVNPGSNRVRMALVAETDKCIEAATRIADFCASLP